MKRRHFHRTALLAALLLLAAPAPCARAQGIDLSSAHPITLDERSGELVAAGGARLAYGDALLTADEIRYNQKTGNATAAGNVVLMRGDARLLATSALYNIESRTFRIENFRAGRPPGFIEGERAEGTFEEFTVTGIRVYLGEPNPVSLRLTAARAKVSGLDRVTAEGVRAHAGPVPLFAWPSACCSLSSPAIHFIDVKAGFSSRLGASVTGTIDWPLGEGWTAGGQAGLYTGRGVLAGPRLSYEPGAFGLDARGSLEAGYIYDTGRLGSFTGYDIPKNRGCVEWRHNQTAQDGRIFANGRFSYLSDPAFHRDFHDDIYDADQQPDSFLEAGVHGDNWVFSAFARQQPCDFGGVFVPTGGLLLHGGHIENAQNLDEFAALCDSYTGFVERLPEIRFDLLPSPLPLGLIHQGAVSVARLKERFAPLTGPFVNTEEDEYLSVVARDSRWLAFMDPEHADDISVISPRGAFEYTRIEAAYRLERPVRIGRALTLTPVAAGRLIFLNDFDAPELIYEGTRFRLADKPGSVRRAIGEAGLDARLQFHGDFAGGGSSGTPRILRHQVDFYAQARDFTIDGRPGYTGAALAGYPLEMPSANTLWSPFDDLYARAADTAPDATLLRTGVFQRLTSRGGEGPARELGRLDLFADFRDGSWTRTACDLQFTPAPWISAEALGSFIPRLSSAADAGLAVTIRDGAIWSLRLSHEYARGEVISGPWSPDIRQYGLDGTLRLNESFQLYTRLRYDAEEDRFNQQVYGLRHVIHNTWALRYEIAFYQGRTREGAFSARVAVSLLRP